MVRISLTIISLTTILFFASPVSAQVYAPTDLIITSDTKYPQPNQQITLRSEYYLSDTNRATVTWYENGSLKQQGIGQTEFVFTVGDVGETTTIRTVLTTQEGVTLSQTRSFTPASLTLVWQADTYTPPFYKGKALASSASPLRIVAIPHFQTGGGAVLDPDTLYYEWNLNGQTLNNGSGQGVQHIDIIGVSNFGETNISVTVTSPGKSLSQKATLSIPLTRPDIVFYQFDPLLGALYQRALSNPAVFEGTSLSIKAEPYFVRNTTKEAGFFRWSGDNETLSSNPSDSSVVSLEKTRGSTGRTTLRAFFETLTQGFGTLEKTITIILN